MGSGRLAVMPDPEFSDVRLAALYDPASPWEDRDDLAFYLPLVHSARSVLDVGCGTGALLRRARQEGHTGRLCGLDPAAAMLAVARTTPGVEWMLGDLGSVPGWDREFDLVVMTGHAFQVFLGDGEVRAASAVIARALTDGGRFVFETRNPLIRPWEDWHIRYSGDVVDAEGRVVRRACRVERPVRGDLVSFTYTYTAPHWPEPLHSRSTLRFLDAGRLTGLLAEAGLSVTERYGDWDRTPYEDTSPEIITVARRAAAPPPPAVVPPR